MSRFTALPLNGERPSAVQYFSDQDFLIWGGRRIAGWHRDFMFLDQTLNSAPVFPRCLRCPGNVPCMGRKQLTDVFVLKLRHGDGLQRLKAVAARRGGGLWKLNLSTLDHRMLGQDDGALDDVFQLPHIAWPFVERQFLHRRRSEAFGGSPGLGREPGDEKARQQRNVPSPLAKWRQGDARRY